MDEFKGIHCVAAVLLIGLSLWHTLYMIFKPWGRETFRELQNRKDFFDIPWNRRRS